MPVAVPAAVVAFLGGLYLRTLAPGLTWAFDGADGGDLITAAATGGVPHPTGYPTYLLLASAFLRLPFGSLAYRTNLLSAASTVAAGFLIYLIVRRATAGTLPAAVAAITFGTFPLIWSQALITEVNAPHGLFIAALLYLALSPSSPRFHNGIFGLVAGLALGNHMSTLLALPLLALGERSPKALLRRAAGLLLGLSVYAIMPLRVATTSPVNWGRASHVSGLLWLVTGRMYWDRLAPLNLAIERGSPRAWSSFLISQLDVLTLFLLFVAFAFVFRRSRLFFATGWLAIVYSLFAIAYSSPDSYVYLIPLLVSLAIWVGLAAGWLLQQASPDRAAMRPLAGALLLAALAARSLAFMPAMDVSHDRAAEDFATEALTSVPPSAIILVSGDEATFSLWYGHFALHRRPDVAVVSTDLLSQSWYRENLAGTYPALHITGDLFNQDWLKANPGRPVCRADTQYGVICDPG